MVNSHKKVWAHYEQLKFILGFYISLFFTVPLVSLGFSCLAHSTEIDGGVQDAIKMALLSGLKWYAIIMPIITALFFIWFLYYSDRVEFTDTNIKYYRWIFSKKTRNICYNEITECVVSGRLWNSNREKTRRRKIIIFNNVQTIIEFDIYHKLALMLVLKIGETKFKLVSDKGNLKTLNKYYNIDFMSLSYEEQLKLLNYYCKLNFKKYKTGEEILKKK